MCVCVRACVGVRVVLGFTNNFFVCKCLSCGVLKRPCTIYVLRQKQQAGNIHIYNPSEQINKFRKYKSLRGPSCFKIHPYSFSGSQQLSLYIYIYICVCVCVCVCVYIYKLLIYFV